MTETGESVQCDPLDRVTLPLIYDTTIYLFLQNYKNMHNHNIVKQ